MFTLRSEITINTTTTSEITSATTEDQPPLTEGNTVTRWLDGSSKNQVTDGDKTKDQLRELQNSAEKITNLYNEAKEVIKGDKQIICTGCPRKNAPMLQKIS